MHIAHLYSTKYGRHRYIHIAHLNSTKMGDTDILKGYPQK